MPTEAEVAERMRQLEAEVKANAPHPRRDRALLGPPHRVPDDAPLGPLHPFAPGDAFAPGEAEGRVLELTTLANCGAARRTSALPQRRQP